MTTTDAATVGINSGTLRIAVASDLHAYDRCNSDKEQEPSHLCTLHPEDIPNQHPISGLLELIDREKLRADLLLCPGDFGDKARPAGIYYGWQAMQKVGERLGVSRVVGTVGNHDVDSRHVYTDPDPKGYLQSLAPLFPLGSDDLNDKFWAKNFAEIAGDAWRLIILNSSAFHGGKEDEIGFGRIADRTLSRLKNLLVSETPKAINLLLCHHHPHKHSEIGLGDFDEMKGGQQLLELIGSGEYGEWLLIHGHKHHPKIQYAAGTQSAPIVFSAGSLCAKLYAELGTRVRNQFYIIELPYHVYSTYGMVGTFAAWDWAAAIGWLPARSSGSGLPARGGFGFRGNLHALSQRVASLVATAALPWAKIGQSIPEVEYLLPDDLSVLFHKIRALNCDIVFDPDGNPLQVGVRS